MSIGYEKRFFGFRGRWNNYLYDSAGDYDAGDVLIAGRYVQVVVEGDCGCATPAFAGVTGSNSS